MPGARRAVRRCSHQDHTIIDVVGQFSVILGLRRLIIQTELKSADIQAKLVDGHTQLVNAYRLLADDQDLSVGKCTHYTGLLFFVISLIPIFKSSYWQKKPLIRILHHVM